MQWNEYGDYSRDGPRYLSTNIPDLGIAMPYILISKNMQLLFLYSKNPNE